MLRVRGDQRGARGQKEVGKVEARCDIAAGEGIPAGLDVRGEVRARRDHRLPGTVGSERAPFVTPRRIDDLERERGAAVEMPGLIGRETVKGGKRLAGQQKVNRCERAA